MSALKAMVSFFTMIRTDITEDDMRDMDQNLHLVPIIGILYGIIAVALMVILTHFISFFASAVLTLFVIQGMNRFLHIDGTIDVGDGLVVAGKREDHLRALKDTRIGAGGMAFALFVILLTVAALSGVPPVLLILIPFVVEILAKNSMVSAAAFGIPGDGMAGNSVRNTTMRSLLYSSIISFVIIVVYTLIAVLIGYFDDYSNNTSLLITIMIALLASVAIGAIMSAIAEKNFGMVNGDVLGATNEISRMIILLLMVAILPVI